METTPVTTLYNFIARFQLMCKYFLDTLTNNNYMFQLIAAKETQRWGISNLHLRWKICSSFKATLEG